MMPASFRCFRFLGLLAAAACAAAVFAQSAPVPAASQPAATRPATTRPDAASFNKRDLVCNIVARHIQDAHGGRNLQELVSIKCDIKVQLDGKTAIDANLLYDARKNRTRLDLDDGSRLYREGSRMWVYPASSAVDARYHLTMWTVLIFAPFHLDKPTNKLTQFRTRPLNGALFDSFLIDLKPTAPWTPMLRQMAFAEPRSHELRALGFWPRAVDPDQPEPQSRLVLFDGYTDIGGLKIATIWTFFNWHEIRSVDGKAVGTGELTGLRIVQPIDSDFVPPESAREVVLPAPVEPQPASAPVAVH